MIKFIESFGDTDETIECLPMIATHFVSQTKFVAWTFTSKEVIKNFV